MDDIKTGDLVCFDVGDVLKIGKIISIQTYPAADPDVITDVNDISYLQFTIEAQDGGIYYNVKEGDIVGKSIDEKGD